MTAMWAPKIYDVWICLAKSTKWFEYLFSHFTEYIAEYKDWLDALGPCPVNL